jgi:transcriptional regulator with XRE-family HTH domain
MRNNRVRSIRTAKGLTQRQLAQVVGTSQQQIQRIEAGRQSVRFDLATRIAYALDSSLAEVFPETAVPLRGLQRRRTQPTFEALSDPRTRDALELAGLDMEPEIWFLKCLLRGGTDHVFRISGVEKNRLWNAVQRTGDIRFAVFESEDKAIALNLDHVLLHTFFSNQPTESKMTAPLTTVE